MALGKFLVRFCKFGVGLQKKTASAVPRVIPSEVEGSRGTTAGLFSGMESLAARTSSAALQPRLRFALLGMTVKTFILDF